MHFLLCTHETVLKKNITNKQQYAKTSVSTTSKLTLIKPRVILVDWYILLFKRIKLANINHTHGYSVDRSWMGAKFSKQNH